MTESERRSGLVEAKRVTVDGVRIVWRWFPLEW
jgi:hypothetical protein